MRRPFPIGWRGKAKRYAVGAVCPARVGRTVCAVRVGGGDFVSAKKFLKEFQKFFPHSQNLIHPFGMLFR